MPWHAQEAGQTTRRRTIIRTVDAGTNRGREHIAKILIRWIVAWQNLQAVFCLPQQRNPQHPSHLHCRVERPAQAIAKWRAFKARLDSLLNSVNVGGYEAYNIPIVADYALGYQCLKDLDPATATSYAEKSISILLSGLKEEQPVY